MKKRLIVIDCNKTESKIESKLEPETKSEIEPETEPSTLHRFRSPHQQQDKGGVGCGEMTQPLATACA